MKASELDLFQEWLAQKGVPMGLAITYRKAAERLVGPVGGGPLELARVEEAARAEGSPQRADSLRKVGALLLEYQRRDAPGQAAVVGARVAHGLARAGSAAGASTVLLFAAFVRASPRGKAFLLGIGALSAVLAFLGIGLISLGEIVIGILFLGLAVPFTAVALYLARVLAGLLRLPSATLGPPALIEGITYFARDGFIYGTSQSGTLEVSAEHVLFSAAYRTAGGMIDGVSLTEALGKAGGLVGSIAGEAIDAARGGGRSPDGAYRFEFLRAVGLPARIDVFGGQFTLGAERFGAVFTSRRALAEALARHGWDVTVT